MLCCVWREAEGEWGSEEEGFAQDAGRAGVGVVCGHVFNLCVACGEESEEGAGGGLRLVSGWMVDVGFGERGKGKCEGWNGGMLDWMFGVFVLLFWVGQGSKSGQRDLLSVVRFALWVIVEKSHVYI